MLNASFIAISVIPLRSIHVRELRMDTPRTQTTLGTRYRKKSH
jgi:hypothetical protein